MGRARVSRWPLAATVGASAMLGLVARSAQAADMPRAHAGAGPVRIGAAPRVPGNGQTLGALAPGAPLDVTIALAPRDPAALQRYATAVSTPGSEAYHRYLSVSAFRGRFAPTDAQIAAVRSALGADGLSPSAVSANGLQITVDGTARQFSQAFSVSFDQVRLAGGRVAYTNTAAPALPSAVAPLVQDVVGLDSLQQVHSDALHRSRAASAPLARPRVATGGPQPCAAASASGALTADLLASGYQFSSLYGAGDEGAGQTIALVEFEPDDPADIAGYAACYGLSTAGISDVTVDGGVGTGTGQGEAALDIEDVLGLAPQATILVYQSSNWFDAYNAVISQDRANVISTSWYDNCNDGAAASGLRQAENTLFQEAATQGESVYVAQGDSGSEACLQNGGIDGTLNVQDPGSQPFVTSVGGTAITALGPRPSETTYNDAAGGAGGGGISKAWTMPGYQSGAPAVLNVINAHSSGAPCAAPTGDCREIPDVSADASDLSPYAIEIAGGWHQFWGTSAAAPTWAAYTALVNASSACHGTAVGFANPLLYALAANDDGNAFNDVTTGTNDLSGGQGGLFPAGAGYDMATGLGTPNGGVLAQDLCAARRSAVAVTDPGDQSDPINSAVSLPIRATDATGARLAFAAAGLPPGLSIDSATGAISGTTTAATDTLVTVTVTDADHATGTAAFRWLVGGSANSRMTVSCSHPSVTQRKQIAAGDPITLRCTALVQRRNEAPDAPKPSGSVAFAVSPAGVAQPAPCTLPATLGVPNSCITKLSTSTAGSDTVTATYSGDSVYHGRTATATLNIK
jgi:Pro-kumamolisin, activation domain/Putative Ig domain